MRALLLDRLPNVSIATKEDANRALNGVRVTDTALVQALLNYGTYDAYYYIRESSDNNKVKGYEQAERLGSLDLGSIESLRTKAPDQVLLFTSSHHIAKFVPFRQFCGHEEWPICGRTHGLSANTLLPSYSWNYIAALNSYDAIVCTSSAGRQALFGIFHGLAKSRSVSGIRGSFVPRMPLIHIDGIALADYPAGPFRDQMENGFVVLSIGRLTASHKADLRPLIAGFLRSSTLPASATLILAGDDAEGHIAPGLQCFADSIPSARRVVLMPNITASTKLALLQIADVALPMSDTYQETFGVSLLEAMAAGLPVVAPNWDGYRDIVVNGETGFLATTSVCKDTGLLNAVSMLIDPAFALGQRVIIDIDSILHSLTLLSRNRALARQMGERGRERARTHFSWQTIVARLEDLWNCQIENGMKLRSTSSVEAFGFMDHEKVFEGHPERLLSTDTVVTLSDDADNLIERMLGGELFSLPPIAGFSGEVDRRIVELCRSQNPISIAELIERVQSEASGPSMVTTQVSRLIKYGLLCLQPEEYAQSTNKEHYDEADSNFALSPVSI
jgi:glycosyltransferase involved in cell wall biosynthesis